jgi:Peptidase family M28
MKKLFLTGLLISITSFLLAQNIDKIINAKEVGRIENKLASDEMRGRKTFTPDIDRAADFIANEFKTIGLQTWSNSGSYRQDFSMISPKLISLSCTFDNKEVDPKNAVVITSSTGFFINEKSGFEKIVIAPGKNLTTEARKLLQAKKNLLVLVDTGYSKSFNRLSGLRRQLFKSDYSVVFVLSVDNPSAFTVEARHDITEQKLANVVGIIPGKSPPAGRAGKKDEYVIFSGHYDHLGVTSNPVNGDSIYNGANDDAAGTTAVIMLAKYFKAIKNNERTIVFVAFTAEEIGGFGSQYFSQQFADPAKVMAMFNIEMIGTESKWGKNSAYITGYEKTDMGKILEKNLEGTGFTFYPDPYTTQNLFYRSDNATLARLGVPAHTISTSKMDSEPNYHKLSDQVETLDMNNMASIIKSVALSARTIISGKDSPSRVKVDELR